MNVDMSSRARTCLKCKQYIVIRSDDADNLAIIKVFEQKHAGHAIVTVDLAEIEGVYRNVEDERGRSVMDKESRKNNQKTP